MIFSSLSNPLSPVEKPFGRWTVKIADSVCRLYFEDGRNAIETEPPVLRVSVLFIYSPK